MNYKQKSPLEIIAGDIETANNVLIITHEKPDGDAIGSVLALLSYFLDNNRHAEAFFPDKLPTSYKKIANLPCVCVEKIPDLRKIDKVICLDCSNFTRLGICPDFKDTIKREQILNIDHHFDNSLFGNLNYIDSTASSTGEILFDVFKKINSMAVSTRTANFILLAIIMDTGGLRFDNTSSKVFTTISALIEIGVNYSALIIAFINWKLI
jgi:phosphoesterase RecJ-like protein